MVLENQDPLGLPYYPQTQGKIILDFSKLFPGMFDYIYTTWSVTPHEEEFLMRPKDNSHIE